MSEPTAGIGETTGGDRNRSPFFILSRLDDAVRLEAARAHPEAPRLAVDACADALQVRVPAPRGLVIGMTDVMTRYGAFAADITNSCHGSVPNKNERET